MTENAPNHIQKIQQYSALILQKTRQLFRLPWLIAVCALILSGPANAQTNNWNQWNRPISWGPSEGTLKLFTAASWQQPDEATHIGLAFGWEYFISDSYSIYGSAGLPLSSELEATSLYPFSGGMNRHFVPKATVDFFIGFGGSLVLVDIEQTVLQSKGLIVNGGEDKLTIRPALSAHLGVAYHFWGMVFLQLEVGYRLSDYADKVFYQDYNTPFVEMKVLGMYF